jgi:hypothetical protein
MNMCQDHWNRLRQKIEERGLAGLIAPDGETAAAQIADQLQRGDDEPTPTNFDPLMSAFFAIGSNVMSMLGQNALYLMYRGDEDPIDFNQFRNGEGVRTRLVLAGKSLTWPRNCGLCYAGLAHELTCDEKGCSLSIVDGYAWMLDRAADDARDRAVQLGLVQR